MRPRSRVLSSPDHILPKKRRATTSHVLLRRQMGKTWWGDAISSGRGAGSNASPGSPAGGPSGTVCQ